MAARSWLGRRQQAQTVSDAPATPVRPARKPNSSQNRLLTSVTYKCADLCGNFIEVQAQNMNEATATPVSLARRLNPCRDRLLTSFTCATTNL